MLFRIWLQPIKITKTFNDLKDLFERIIECNYQIKQALTKYEG